MYFVLELDGRRELVRAKKTASIGQVTIQAFGPTAKDARVVGSFRKRWHAVGARYNSPSLPLEEAATSDAR
jgi:hypothetical protein